MSCTRDLRGHLLHTVTFLVVLLNLLLSGNQLKGYLQTVQIQIRYFVVSDQGLHYLLTGFKKKKKKSDI